MAQRIGQMICQLRKQKNITQTQLAEYLFVTPQTVSKWEAGNGSPDIAILPRIALFFNVSMDELFGLTGMEKVEDMVLRYSVLRDEESFQRAQQMLACAIEDVDRSCGEEGIRSRALMSHLYLQNCRESIRKSLDTIEDARRYLDGLEKELQGEEKAEEKEKEKGKKKAEDWYAGWGIRLQLQSYLLRLMNGEYRAVQRESREAFENAPGRETLYVYFAVLLMVQEYEKVAKLVSRDAFTKELVEGVDKENLKIRMQLLDAYTALGFTEEALKLSERMEEFCSSADQLEMQIYLARLSKDDREGLQRRKEQMYALLGETDYHDYVKMDYRRWIDGL